jgi:hypothetical protein
MKNTGDVRPTGCITFSIWKRWDAREDLLPSGFSGPVMPIEARKLQQ